MKKRILSLALTLVMLLSLAVPAAAAGSYRDVPAGHWSYATVTRATQLGIFNGMGNDRFGLGEPITKAAFATALVRLFGWKEVSPAKASFSDVKSGSWYFTAVETAKANGAIPASGKTFQPNRYITRQEMASMIVRGLGYTDLAGTLSTYSSPFTDVKANKGFITIAYDLGIVNGVGNGKFAPTSTATREQAATMLVRLYDKLHSESTQLKRLDDFTPLRIDPPTATEMTDIPTTPLEPMAELYLALQKLKNSGADMSRVALCLTAGGLRTLTDKDGKIVASDTLSANQVNSILRGTGVRTYYSDRYDSAYCIYSPNIYQTSTVWYQSERSQTAKVRIASLFGVTHYMLE